MSYKDNDVENIRMKMVGGAGGKQPPHQHLININKGDTCMLELQFYFLAHLVKNKDIRN